jgi:hypothetical protein
MATTLEQPGRMRGARTVAANVHIGCILLHWVRQRLLGVEPDDALPPSVTIGHSSHTHKMSSQNQAHCD